MEQASGISREQALGKAIVTLFPELEGGRVYQAVEMALAEGFPSVLSPTLNKAPFPLFYRHQGGKPLARIQQSIQVMPLSSHVWPRHCLVQITDVTAAIHREQTIRSQAADLRETQQRQAALLDSIPDIAFLKDLDGRFIAVNQAFRAAFDVDDCAGKTVYDVFPEMIAKRYDKEDREVSQAGTVKRYDDILTSIAGEQRWVDVIKVPIRNDSGEVIGLAGVTRDITARKESESRVHYLAHFDALTRLPNRVMLHDRLAVSFANARRRNRRVALLFLDIDRFKVINDSLGHDMGDKLLQSVAERLQQCTREVDTVARLGGDEFVVALADLEQPADAAGIAQKILDSVSQPAKVGNYVLNSSTSIGISVFPEDGEQVDILLKNADTAMYQAKQNGRNGYEFFTCDMKTQAEDRLRLEHGLRQALERQELDLVYQQQVDLATGRIVCVEAQLRWMHSEMGMVMPTRFISIAEEAGLIVPIGEWVLRTACAQNKAWQAAGLPPIPVAVNLSAVQLRHKGFLATVENVLADTGLPSQYLELEITEGVIMDNAETTISTLDALKRMGVRLAIDDFGTGYSSLSYLKRFPIDKLKIDQSFVRDIMTDPDDAAITGTIIAMARHLNLKVIAEGVETQAQLELLRGQGCDEVQGFYFSRPVNSEMLMQQLANQ
jgi:diguanylate cyclase (GGDEF)-like protein/PAS domain S-box-containing protein